MGKALKIKDVIGNKTMGVYFLWFEGGQIKEVSEDELQGQFGMFENMRELIGHLYVTV
jgi:hypothetical protein